MGRYRRKIKEMDGYRQKINDFLSESHNKIILIVSKERYREGLLAYKLIDHSFTISQYGSRLLTKLTVFDMEYNIYTQMQFILTPIAKKNDDDDITLLVDDCNDMAIFKYETPNKFRIQLKTYILGTSQSHWLIREYNQKKMDGQRFIKIFHKFKQNYPKIKENI